MPAPEWSEAVEAFWGEDGQPITDETTADWWYRALNTLFEWRIEQGMQPRHVVVPIDF